ncbi:MAG: YchJ family metal-binding protein [Archangium sp.]
MKCPCGAGEYETCCGPRHDGSKPAETAEALMRSRYSAFARADVAYLQKTQSKPADETWEQTRQWATSVAWVGLTIHEALENVVEFTAQYLEGGEVTALRERSSFTQNAEGRWIYDSGKPTVTRTKVERNQPCPCGSGRKFKQCHA